MNDKKKIAIIGTAGVPARYGGFETLAHNLVLNLNDTYDMHVYASTKMYSKSERIKEWEKAKIHYIPLGANGVSSIFYDLFSMIHSIFYADYIIVLGVSAGIFIPLLRLFTRAKIIVNIDGLEWRRNKWNTYAKRFLKFSEKVAVRFSHADITDNAAIKRYTAINYKTASYLIAYGADHVSHQPLTKADYKKYPFLNTPYAFKVARIEPENNVGLILKSFSKIPNKKLVIVGNWANSNYGIQLKEMYSKFKNIYLLDPIYDQIELDKIRSNCYLYVHGHSAGGTNPSLVEAMYLGLPIMAFDVSYNRATTSDKAIFFKSEKDLIQLLDNTGYEYLKYVANELQQLAKVKYTWNAISKRYSALIKAFHYDYQKPKLTVKVTKMPYTTLLKTGHAHLNHSTLFFENSSKT
jgi:glycosyltransferase involved in cell wall biosynthesis